jgi:hypothetical protein
VAFTFLCRARRVEDDAGDAVAALDGAGFDQGLLDGMDLGARLTPSMVRTVAPASLDAGRRQARLASPSRDDRAGAAGAVVAAALGAGQVEVLAEDVDDLVRGFDGDAGARRMRVNWTSSAWDYSWGLGAGPQAGQAGSRLAWRGRNSTSSPS